MNYKPVLILALIFPASILAVAQSPDNSPGNSVDERPRIVADENGPELSPTPSPTPFAPVVITKTDRPVYPPPSTPTPTPVYRPAPPTSTATPIYVPRVTPTPAIVTANDYLSERVLPPPTYNGKLLNIAALKAKLNEARSYMQSRPMQISSVENVATMSTDTVRIAALDTATSRMHYILTSKTSFLSRDLQFFASTSEGKNVTVRVVRVNGVNTAVTVTDERNQSLLPIIVQYPVERNGVFYEMAYYSSAHPGTISAEVAYYGKMYLRNIIDTARQNLKQKGVFISPQVADIAERLCTVEHVDHYRFNNEFQLGLFNEIFTLFALNEGNTYRYAVSTAGAGGLVQMIPSTYSMVRNRHFNVGLIPNFVDGMRNHSNAAQAMLLYMQDTWNDLSSSSDVLDAMSQGYATQAELMSAGYNSNPARLPGYIRRGGANWKFLIPRETQIYHRIYASLDKFVPMTPRAK
ncbi:MAG TPA: hypothetical protein VGO50_06960 [Pyrinomonadaceae bacterium]|jgi:hypothetical protein|nr:hypothetical protein [Pyrinomonadaceae bacterium]